MAKLFISQPMRGLTDEQILSVRQKAIEKATPHIHTIFGTAEPVEVLDTFFQDHTITNIPGLYHLGKSIKMMAEADVAYFCEGWDQARGCRIENQCALEYGLPLVVEDYSGDTKVQNAPLAAEKGE